MLLVHIGIASLRQFQCAPTTYVNSINECFSPQISQLHLMFQCNEHGEMNQLLCRVACTWITITDSQFYIISLS